MLIQFTGQHHYDGDNMELFWKMYRLVHELHDSPIMWKLDESLIKVLSDFLSISTDSILTMNFMDASIDYTSKPPALLCAENTYPFTLVMY